jgi:hypothetical protein
MGEERPMVPAPFGGARGGVVNHQVGAFSLHLRRGWRGGLECPPRVGA